MRYFSVLVVLLLLTVVSCQDDEEVAQQGQSVSIDGYVQKGPFINGTAITVSELNQKLIATGKNFTTQIIDNKGSFSLKDITLQSNFVQLIAEGFYFDEVRGEKSAAQLTLFALADVSNMSSVNVNLLSHLEKDRVIYLMQEEEKSFATAKKQAQQEILAIFGIEKTDMTTSELLDISQDGDDNAILLAVSAILQGNNTVAELSELLADIITDIREDGMLNSESTQEKIRVNAMSLTLADIRQHLEARYGELGVDATIPNFEQYIDSDGDGFLNRDDDDTPDDFAFETQVDVAVDTVVVSNEIVVSGLKEGGTTSVSVSHGHLIINDLLITDSIQQQASNGDKIQLQLVSSSKYDDEKIATVQIGSLRQSFRVTTDDYVPNAFSFSTQREVAVVTYYTSDTITVSGLPHATPITVENATLIKNGKEVTGSALFVVNSDQIALRLLSSEAYASTTTAKLRIGGMSINFEVITDDYAPNKFSFTPIEHAKRDSTYISETVTISGLLYATPITTNQGVLLINGEVSSSESTVVSGDQIAVQLTASSIYETTVNSSIRIGATNYAFTVTTTSNPWQRKADGPGSIYYSLLVNEELLAISPPTSQVSYYNFAKNQWRTISTIFPDDFISRGGMVSFTIANKAYYGLGTHYDEDSGNDVIHRDFWEYDPIDNAWTRKADFPGNNLFDATSFSIEGRGYVGTGIHLNFLERKPGYDRKNTLSLTREFWEYNPTTDQWTQKADFPGARRYGATSFAINGKGYILAGDSTLYAPVPTSTYAVGMYEYDPNTNQWTQKAEIPEPQYYNGRATSCVINSIAYINFFRDMWFQVYDPSSNSWIVLEDAVFQDSELNMNSLRVFGFNEKVYAVYSEMYRDVTQLWEFTPSQE